MREIKSGSKKSYLLEIYCGNIARKPLTVFGTFFFTSFNVECSLHWMQLWRLVEKKAKILA